MKSPTSLVHGLFRCSPFLRLAPSAPAVGSWSYTGCAPRGLALGAQQDGWGLSSGSQLGIWARRRDTVALREQMSPPSHA